MALILTSEEQALAESVRKFVADRSPLTSLRHLITSGEPYDGDVWKQMTAQLGLAGLTIPESYGGVGAGYSALSVALTELGAGLLAAETLLRLEDDEAREDLLPKIAGGELIATLAVASEAGGRVTASGSPVGATLTGTVSPVLNGAEASVLIVAGEADGVTGLYLVDAGADGLTATRLTAVDHSRSLARITL